MLHIWDWGAGNNQNSPLIGQFSDQLHITEANKSQQFCILSPPPQINHMKLHMKYTDTVPHAQKPFSSEKIF